MQTISGRPYAPICREVVLKENELIGALSLSLRKFRFAEKQIELVKNFANQAVIAIETALLRYTNPLSGVGCRPARPSNLPFTYTLDGLQLDPTAVLNGNGAPQA